MKIAVYILQDQCSNKRRRWLGIDKQRPAGMCSFAIQRRRLGTNANAMLTSPLLLNLSWSCY